MLPLRCCPLLHIVMTPVYRVAAECKEAELALTEYGLTVSPGEDASSLACTQVL